MKFATLNHNAFALRLEPGDDILGSLQDFCAMHTIANAKVEGIGSVEDPKLAHYSLRTKQFTDHQLEGDYEIISLLGNIALKDGRPMAHLHITISDERMRTGGGHLLSGKCSAIVEVIVTSYPTRYAKVHDDALGLDAWEF
jgi:uncharacterized protein